MDSGVLVLFFLSFIVAVWLKAMVFVMTILQMKDGWSGMEMGDGFFLYNFVNFIFSYTFVLTILKLIGCTQFDACRLSA